MSSNTPDNCIDKTVHELLTTYIAIAIADLEFIPADQKSPEALLDRIQQASLSLADAVSVTPYQTTALRVEILRLRQVTEQWQETFRQRDSHNADTQP